MGGMLKVWRSNEEARYGEGRRDGVREEVVSRDAFYLFTLEIMFSVVREERNMILKKLPGAFQGIVAKVEFCQDRVFIEYCVFSKILTYILDSGLSRFSLGVSVCTQWQVK